MTDAAPDPTLDAPPPDDLAGAFVLPEYLAADPRLVTLHTNIVTRLRREAAGMPMNTVQQLLLERIALNYIVLKFREGRAVGDGGFGRGGEQKDFNTFWLSMTVEFNKLLLANQDKMREALLLEVQSVVTDVMSQIKDPAERRTLRRNLSEKFASIDL